MLYKYAIMTLRFIFAYFYFLSRIQGSLALHCTGTDLHLTFFIDYVEIRDESVGNYIHEPHNHPWKSVSVLFSETGI